jgi:prepilin-type N-terminal cleavage/methylation domain-containing protein
MNHPPVILLGGRQGFTLIEVMLSVALGALVVYTATAGFRVAAQSVTIVNRLSVENAIMRGGLQQAHDRLDFWTDCDNPDLVSEQTLRGKDANGGLPFTPMRDVFPRVPSTEPEAATGWDPAETWSAHDPRNWWHGSVAEKFNTSLVLGRYAVFANTKRDPHVQSPMMFGPAPTDYGTVRVPHSWLYNQIWGLHNALGYYGFADYLPANTLFACYGEVKEMQANAFDNSNQGGMPRLLMQPGSSFDNGEGNQEYCKGLWRLTMVSAYGLVSPTHPSATQPAAHQKKYIVGYWNNGGDFTRLINETDNSAWVLSLDGPAAWPKATVSVARFIKTARFVSLCKVRWTSPLTGETAQLAFAGFGTTLRGARQQRRLTGGWAAWDGPANASNDRTLDDTP